MKYFIILLMVFGMQIVRVADDVDHLQDSEKCRPCYHHRLLETEMQPEHHNYKLIDTVSKLV